jgi:hypothetical protein
MTSVDMEKVRFTDRQAEQIAELTGRCLNVFIEHYGRMPTKPEARFMLMASVRVVLAHEAPSLVVQ